MKTIFLLTLTASLAADIQDIGTVSERRGIVIERCERRPDFAAFKIEFFPQTWPTNAVAIVKTNDLLTLGDLTQLPSGPVIMAIQQICEDGAESPVSLFKFEIRRSNPTAPRARTVELLNDAQTHTASNALRRLMDRKKDEADAAAPPVPGVRLEGIIIQGKPQSALPGGRNESYAEHLDEMAAHFAKTGRRSE